jgi:biopolymer transport protein ExbB
MLNTFIQGGQYMWVLLILAIVNIVLAVRKGIVLFSNSDKELSRMGEGIHAILFWGIMAAVIGFYAHFTGIYFAMQAIMEANDISPAIVAEGYAVSLITILFGLIIFILSAIVWFVLRWRFTRLTRT